MSLLLSPKDMKLVVVVGDEQRSFGDRLHGGQAVWTKVPNSKMDPLARWRLAVSGLTKLVVAAVEAVDVLLHSGEVADAEVAVVAPKILAVGDRRGPPRPLLLQRLP